MKKYVLSVYEPEENESLLYEVNIEALYQSLDRKVIHHIKQALDDKKEITLKSMGSKELALANEIERD